MWAQDKGRIEDDLWEDKFNPRGDISRCLNQEMNKKGGQGGITLLLHRDTALETRS